MSYRVDRQTDRQTGQHTDTTENNTTSLCVDRTGMTVCDTDEDLFLLKPNTHRRRDETVLSRRVGVGGVYMNS